MNFKWSQFREIEQYPDLFFQKFNPERKKYCDEQFDLKVLVDASMKKSDYIKNQKLINFIKVNISKELSKPKVYAFSHRDQKESKHVISVDSNQNQIDYQIVIITDGDLFQYGGTVGAHLTSGNNNYSYCNSDGSSPQLKLNNNPVDLINELRFCQNNSANDNFH